MRKDRTKRLQSTEACCAPKLARDHFMVMGQAILAHSEVEPRRDTILTSFSYGLEYISRS